MVFRRAQVVLRTIQSAGHVGTGRWLRSDRCTGAKHCICDDRDEMRSSARRSARQRVDAVYSSQSGPVVYVVRSRRNMQHGKEEFSGLQQRRRKRNPRLEKRRNISSTLTVRMAQDKKSKTDVPNKRSRRQNLSFEHYVSQLSTVRC